MRMNWRRMSSYHQRPEWSYSELKNIELHGIDWAVAAKRGMLPSPKSAAIDTGTLVHQELLGGDDKFVVSPYPDFRTKEAREWRDSVPDDTIVLKQEQYDEVKKIAERVRSHKSAMALLSGRPEIEMYATIDGLRMRGKADSILVAEKTIDITDLKTTAKFDEFKYKTFRNQYDLQSAVYYGIVHAAEIAKGKQIRYNFVIAETVAPYRVQIAHANDDFITHGEDKLMRCAEAIREFGDKDPNFNIEEVLELGDLSL